MSSTRVFPLSKTMRYYDLFTRLGLLVCAVFTVWIVIYERQRPSSPQGGWVIPAGLGLVIFLANYLIAHVGAEILVDEAGLTTRHGGWRLWPSQRRLRVRIPRHLPAHELGRVETIHDFKMTLGAWFGGFHGEKIKMTSSAWGTHTKKAIAVIQERPGLKRRLWLLDVDDPDPIADALITVRDAHNPGYQRRLDDRAERAARLDAIASGPDQIDASRLMPAPADGNEYEPPIGVPGHRALIFDNVLIHTDQPSPPFTSYPGALFRLTITAITRQTPFTEMIGPGIHLINVNQGPDPATGPDGTELKRTTLGRSITVKPGDGTFFLRPTQSATIRLERLL